MVRRILAVAAAFLVVSVVPQALRAQTATPGLRPGVAAYAATAHLAPAPLAAGSTTQVVAQSRPNQRRTGVILMIVGAAGIVTGIAVDEPIVTVAGAGVAGFGLYMWLNSGGQLGLRAPLP